MAQVVTSGSSTGIQHPGTLAVNGGAIQSPDYAYYVAVCLVDEDLTLHNVRVYYTES